MAHGERVTIAATSAGLLAVPVATWWLVGDLSSPGGDDYAVRPLDVSPAVERGIGVAAVAIVVSALVVAVSAGGWTRVRRWARPVLALAAAGVIVGWGWRVVTAGVIGANIGAGLVVLFGGPVVAVLVVGAAVDGGRLRRTGGHDGRALTTVRFRPSRRPG
jgi:hypothetical protein